eukprot:c6662_g1_i1.p1 GENE.c6662_g1_i1~~c6662_g1_i1.p1  ORF type:complete len:183 (+),score=38.44 c6662_g1_i1:1-549(+)
MGQCVDLRPMEVSEFDVEASRRRKFEAFAQEFEENGFSVLSSNSICCNITGEWKKKSDITATEEASFYADILFDGVFELMLQIYERNKTIFLSTGKVSAGRRKYYGKGTTKLMKKFYGMIMVFETFKSRTNTSIVSIYKHYETLTNNSLPLGKNKFQAIFSCMIPDDQELFAFYNLFTLNAH